MKTVLFFIAMLHSNYPGVEIDAKETKCIAHAIYHEARGESVMGQAAVGYVIRNRKVDPRRYPNTFCQVVYQSAQFTDIKNTKITAKVMESKEWKSAVEIAVNVQVGFVDNPIGMATMYHNPKKIAKPDWDWSKLTLVGNVENHRFYVEKDLRQLASIFADEAEWSGT